jgi:hypothetical protein
MLRQAATEVNHNMSIRIRVYPQYGRSLGGYGGLGGYGYGGYGVQARVTAQKLKNEKQKSNLRLQYERALFAERLKTVQLQTALQYGGGYGYGVRPAMPMSFTNAFMGAGGMGFSSGPGFFGGLGLGGLGGLL